MHAGMKMAARMCQNMDFIPRKGPKMNFSKPGMFS